VGLAARLVRRALAGRLALRVDLSIMVDDLKRT
jgi:hypothetical protein